MRAARTEADTTSLRATAAAVRSLPEAPKLNKIEALKHEKDGLDALPDIERHAACGDPTAISDDDAQRMKWYGLFVRRQTPGHMMMRLRSAGGLMNSRQWRVIADLSDRHGRGFCDLTTRQQVQMRWFTIGEVPGIWGALHDVGLTSQQTGMDNVRGVCGCPVAGLTPSELFDASPVAREFTSMLLGNQAFTNLPRKFNVTITGCLENCCPAETQDIGLIPATKPRAELGGMAGCGLLMHQSAVQPDAHLVVGADDQCDFLILPRIYVRERVRRDVLSAVEYGT